MTVDEDILMVNFEEPFTQLYSVVEIPTLEHKDFLDIKDYILKPLFAELLQSLALALMEQNITTDKFIKITLQCAIGECMVNYNDINT